MPYRSLMGAVALAAWLASWLAMGPAAAQAQDLSKYPDWSGQWKKPDEIGNGQWDIAKPRGPGQQAPLTPEYKAIPEARMAERASGGLGGDPTAQCIPHGMPRMMIGVYPMELVVTPKTTYMLSDYNEPRRIFTDGRDWPREIESDLQRLFDRPMDRPGRRRPLQPARGREPRLQGSAHLRGHRHPATRRRGEHHQGALLSRPGRQGPLAHRRHHHRPCADAALDGVAALSARPQPDLDVR
jgi:hypothetical protein